jgi:hypothetical protein
VSAFTRTRTLTVLAAAAALATTLAAAPAAQAATSGSATVKHMSAIRPDTLWVNCSAYTVGFSGGTYGQWYFDIACSDVNATSWGLAIECSNDDVYTAGMFTTFENVQLDCPAPYTVTAYEILYTS